MAHIFVAYDMQDTSKCSKGFKTFTEAETFLDSSSELHDDWEICKIEHPTKSQVEMLEFHLTICCPEIVKH